MSRPLKLPVKKTSSGWMLDIPADLSPTGKRTRRTFEKKKIADLERTRLLQGKKIWGAQATQLTPAVAQDAAEANALLRDFDMSLREVAKHWLEWKEAHEKSLPVSDLWKEHKQRKSSSISDAYAKDLEKYGDPVMQEIGEVQVSDLSARQLEQAILRFFKTARQFSNAARTIRPAFSFAVRRGYCQQNPFDRIEPRKVPSRNIQILSLAEVKAAFNACQDWRTDENVPLSYRLDCRDCVPAVALMLFAGIRPKEIERLQWEDIHFDHASIRVGAHVAKTRSTRIVPIENNLRLWLEETPKIERTGSIVPPNWKAKIKAIRSIGGFSHYQDVLRHSFASYHLAAKVDLNSLQEAMGHSTPEMVLKHYRALVSKKDAIAFWSICPRSTSQKPLEALA